MYNDIFLFVKLVNHGSFRKLANLIKLSQSTISRRIQSLETQLNKQLIKRSNNGILLTNEGEALYKHFVHYEAELNTALDVVTTQYNGLSGTIRIALHPTISARLISAKIPLFQELYPQAKLIIKYVNDAVNMTLDNYDLAISSRMPTSQDSKIKLLSKLELKLYTTPAYVHKFGIPQDLNELGQRSFIGSLNDDNTPMINYVAQNEQTKQQLSFVNESKLYVNNMLHALEMVKSNRCIVAAWSLLVKNQLARHELIPVLADYNFGNFNCYLIRRNAVPTELEREFIEFIERCFVEID